MIAEQLTRLSSSGASSFLWMVLQENQAVCQEDKYLPICGDHIGLAYTGSRPISIALYSETVAQIQVRVDSLWLKKPPLVHCREPWIRKEENWHVSPEGLLCWDLPERWDDRCNVALRMLGKEEAHTHLAQWLLQSVESLLKYHRIGAERGYQEWPAEWSEFSHGDLGRKQYFGEREQFRRQLTKQLRRNNNMAMTAKTN